MFGSFIKNTMGIAVCFAAAKLVLHMLTNGQYGFFRDELYFLACGEHLDWGYVDAAPLASWLAALSRHLFGESLQGLRFFSALAGALKMLMIGLIVRELGGGRFAAFLACLCILVSPAALAADTLFSMNAWEGVFWSGCALSVILIVRRNEPRYWLLFGIFAGLGMMNKHSALFFGVSLLLGLLLTPARRTIWTKWFWIGGGLALLIFLPNLIWQINHDWATLELLRNVQEEGKNVVLSPLDFIGQQVFLLLPLTLPIWLGGLYYLLTAGEEKPWRFLGFTYLLLLAAMIAMKAKNYYLMPVYPLLFAAGGVYWENRLETLSRFTWLRWVYPALILVGGVLLAPMGLPLLSPPAYIQYEEMLGIAPPKSEVAHRGPLPQHFGDMFGWEEMAAQVAKAYHALPEEEQKKAVILAGNYGEAGAIDFFGHEYGLPKAISAHQNYYLWGWRDAGSEVVILLQFRKEELDSVCASVTEAGRVSHPYAMVEEQFPIYICRGLKYSFGEIWESMKHWN